MKPNSNSIALARSLISGDYSTAKNHVVAHLDSQAETVKNAVGENITQQLFKPKSQPSNINEAEAQPSGSKAVRTSAGVVYVKRGSSGTTFLFPTSGKDPVKVATEYAKVIDDPKRKYSAKMKGDNTVTLLVGGSPLYDMKLVDGFIQHDVSNWADTDDIDYFMKHGKFEV